MYLKVNTLLHFRYYSHLCITFLYIFHNPTLRVQGANGPLYTEDIFFLEKNGAVALVIFQEYLYILCEFVEHSFETICSKRRRLSNKMYKYSRF